MKGQKCSVCGYKISARESILLNIGKVLGEASKRIPKQQAFGTNTISNITEMCIRDRQLIENQFLLESPIKL